MATVTSAGAGSGIDLESVISASVAAKKAQLQTPITKQQSSAQVTLSGLGSLKSAISTYMTSLTSLSEKGAFNKRAINITQSTDDPILKVESKSGASNGQYNITVNKLATTSRFEGEFTDATSSLIDADGQLTFTAGVSGKSFTVDVKAGDSLQSIRSRINSDGDNFGLTANIITTANGTAKLVFDSGVSGEGNNLSVAASTSELKIFDPTITDAELNALPHASAVVAKIKKTQDATSAVIDVDGTALKSASNVFEDTIQGLKITPEFKSEVRHSPI